MYIIYHGSEVGKIDTDKSNNEYSCMHIEYLRDLTLYLKIFKNMNIKKIFTQNYSIEII